MYAKENKKILIWKNAKSTPSWDAAVTPFRVGGLGVFRLPETSYQILSSTGSLYSRTFLWKFCGFARWGKALSRKTHHPKKMNLQKNLHFARTNFIGPSANLLKCLSWSWPFLKIPGFQPAAAKKQNETADQTSRAVQPPFHRLLWVMIQQAADKKGAKFTGWTNWPSWLPLRNPR